MVVPPEGIQDGVLQVLGVIEHGLGEFPETRNHQPGVDGDVTAVSGEVTQAIQRRVGFERPTIIGECHKGSRIKTDLELIREGPLNSRVQAHAGALEGDLNVGTSAAQTHRAHEQRATVVHTLVGPLNEANTEFEGLQTPSVLKF